MTIEEFEQASEIYRKYDEIEDIIERSKGRKACDR